MKVLEHPTPDNSISEKHSVQRSRLGQGRGQNRRRHQETLGRGALLCFARSWDRRRIYVCQNSLKINTFCQKENNFKRMEVGYLAAIFKQNETAVD